MKYIEAYQEVHVSFWEMFPYFASTHIFKKLYKEDRSKDKNKSSKTMWYLVFVKDLDSEYYSMSREEQHEIVCDILDLDVEAFVGKEQLELLLNAFEDFIDTPLSSDVRALERKLIERKQFISETKYTLDTMIYPEEGETFKPYKAQGTAAQLDKMVTDTKKIHEEIRGLREALKNSVESIGRGGKEMGFLDRG